VIKVKNSERLEASMRAEEKSVSARVPKYDRFERAEEALKSSPKRGVDRERPVRKRVIRDAFTLPEEDHELIASLRQRAGKQGVLVTKSEVIRAGLKVLNQMRESSLKEALEAVEKLKPGRPGNR